MECGQMFQMNAVEKSFYVESLLVQAQSNSQSNQYLLAGTLWIHGSSVQELMHFLHVLYIIQLL